METPSLSHFNSKDYDKFYEPAEDSFLLLDALEEELDVLRSLEPTLCIEIGSGSGIVITAVAKALGRSCCCVAVDLNPAACEATQKTSIFNGTDVKVVNMDLLSGFCWKNQVDILIFNPPYVVTPSEEMHEDELHGDLTKAWSGGEKGREVRFLSFCLCAIL
jgi:HemK-related putative methylase